ncbi:unnamed protein product [Musa banksii]
MGRKTTWVVPPTISLSFSGTLAPPLTRFLPIATTSSIPESQPQFIASRPPPPPSPHPQKSHPKSAFLHLVDSLARSLRSILPSRPPATAASPATPTRRPISPPRPRSEAGCALPLFRPYVAKVPWHGGVRAFLSQLFPRYGHYCGPNWSSGKDGGSMLWDRRPVDWLDFCCYCHDIGYDTHDQAKLLKADLAFLDCLEKTRMTTERGGVSAAVLYRAMCTTGTSTNLITFVLSVITMWHAYVDLINCRRNLMELMVLYDLFCLVAGLRNIIIPYRMHLVKLQSGSSLMEVFNNLISKVTYSSNIEAEKRKDML